MATSEGEGGGGEDVATKDSDVCTGAEDRRDDLVSFEDENNARNALTCLTLMASSLLLDFLAVFLGSEERHSATCTFHLFVRYGSAITIHFPHTW